MTNHGDDCYFFYYSTCSKGDSCPFRHCEAAMGIETVCNLWQEGRCFRTLCKFRHMEITKNRKEIACYWEKQPAGCQKPHCAFSHDRARYIDGVYVPPNKCQIKNEDLQQEEPAPPPAAPLPTANPQLRGVMKAETLETVPSPTHPPVVINAADDDEDEDDQFSEEGEEGKVGQDGSRLTSPRKMSGGHHSDQSLNFGVSTLEEIRLRKALKASMKRAAYPIQTTDAFANGVNMQSSFLPGPYEASNAPGIFEETGRPRGSVAERLGRKIHSETGHGAPLRKSLAGRLGNVMENEVPFRAPQKALKSIRERLCLPDEPDAATQDRAENNMDSKRAPEQIRIKTLEEIRKEKAAKSQSQNDPPSDSASEISTTKAVTTKATKGTRRDVTVGDAPVGIKTLSELLHAKKRRQEEQIPDPKKAKYCAEKALGKTAGEPDTSEDGATEGAGVKVKVKTLEEIRREKAAKTQAQQVHEVENGKNAIEENSAKRPRLLRANKEASNGSITTEVNVETTEKPSKPQPSAPQTSVKVKTFEEIMREKRLRKQEMEEQSSSPSQPAEAEAEPAQKPSVGATLKRKALAKPSSSPPATSPLCSSPSTQKAPIRKLMTLKPKAASPVDGAIAATVDSTAITAVTSVSVKPSSPPSQVEADWSSQSPGSPRELPKTNTRSSPASSPAKQARAAKSAPAVKTQNNTQKKSTQAADTKVRPKLNVKPSVMKPAVKVKPGHKGKAANRSAVAAVKPLNSATTLLQETACKEPEVFQSSAAEAQLSPAGPQSPSTPECTPLPQSPVVKTPAQSKSRKPSLSSSRIPSASSTAASTAAVDDFDDLINEFSGDHLGEDMDPSIGEDDLLQELSEMIGS
ncbi:zinc finger CCCH domain-containing protein 11A [Genypterus blacodes]|uniref:zinc finger CCCH domain-containing protein 11A n=1 Tax=Genypterus blacodes TaxID=154954 RepID=UPI003F772FD1